MKRLTDWLARNSLWAAAIGLCLASSGIDGRYMAAWMPNGMGWLGYVLNTVSDLSGMVIMHHYSRLQQTRRNEAGGKRRLQLSRVLLGAEVVTVGYSWFLGWRQLLIVLPAIEPVAWPWVAPVAAGFVPLLLAFIGYTQGLLAGRIESAVAISTATQSGAVSESASLKAIIVEREPMLEAAHSDNGSERACPYCGERFGSPQAVSAHLRWCEAYQTQKANIATCEQCTTDNV